MFLTLGSPDIPARDGTRVPLADPRMLVLELENARLVDVACRALELHAASERSLRQQAEDFAAIIHELRSPLSPISNSARLLEDNPSDEILVLKASAVITRQALSLTRLIDDLLDVSRIKTGKLRINPEEVDLNEILSDVVSDLRSHTDKRMQRLSLQLPAVAPRVIGDALRLTQVFTNLIDNASKYTPSGGHIAVLATPREDAIEVAVCDDGIGIAPDALPHIFKPFIQEAYATTFNGTGLGIGLTVVRELVKAHKGSITATSDGRDQGSSFIVVLPLSA